MVRISWRLGARSRRASASLRRRSRPGPGGCSALARGAAGVLAAGAVQTCATTITVPESAEATEPYWRRDGEADRYVFAPDAPFGAPFAPSPFRARVSFAFGTHGRVSLEQPLQHRYEGSIFSGEKRTELLVVPALSVRVAPEIAVVPVGVGPKRTAAQAAAHRKGIAQAVPIHRRWTPTLPLNMPSAWWTSCKPEIQNGQSAYTMN